MQQILRHCYGHMAWQVLHLARLEVAWGSMAFLIRL